MRAVPYFPSSLFGFVWNLILFRSKSVQVVVSAHPSSIWHRAARKAVSSRRGMNGWIDSTNGNLLETFAAGSPCNLFWIKKHRHLLHIKQNQNETQRRVVAVLTCETFLLELWHSANLQSILQLMDTMTQAQASKDLQMDPSDSANGLVVTNGYSSSLMGFVASSFLFVDMNQHQQG